MPDELTVGAALDAAVGELMGAVPVAVTSLAGMIVPLHPDYSTTDAGMGRVLGWLVSQGWQPILKPFGSSWACTLTAVDGKARKLEYDTYIAPTRAEAVCRVALLTQDQE